MKILHYTGKGYGFMDGITEYVILSDDSDGNDEDHGCPGFTLDSETEVGELPGTLPLDEILIPRK